MPVEFVNPFQKFVSEHARLLRGGRKLPLGKLKRAGHQTKISPGAPKVLIFSPHPDDECITGGLALRLLREPKWNVINVAVTLGSKRERRAARSRELQNACASLGFGLLVPGWRGLERINPEARRRNRAHWRASVKIIADILAEQKPRVIFVGIMSDVGLWSQTQVVGQLVHVMAQANQHCYLLCTNATATKHTSARTCWFWTR